MNENKKLKRDLVLQSFAPLFLFLAVKHFYCYWNCIPVFISQIHACGWGVVSTVIHYEHIGSFAVFLFSTCWIIWAILTYCGFAGFFRVGFDSRGESIVISTDKRDTGAMFLVSFVLPLLLDDVDTIRGFIVFAMLLFMMIKLLVNSNLFYQNPVLTILGYKTFEFKFVNPYVDIAYKDRTYIGITKGKMVVEEAAIKRKFISDDVFIVVNE